MNNFSRRRATSIVVSLVLVVLIAAAGLLCLFTLKNNNTLDDGGDVSLEKVATYSDYGMTPVTYDSTNSALAGIKLNDDDYVWVYFPSAIYLDKTETLADAGYFYNFIGHYGDSNNSDYRQVLFQTVIGFYGTTSGAPSDGTNMATYFNDFSSTPSVPNGAKKNLNLNDTGYNYSGNAVVSFEGGVYDNSQFHMLGKLAGTPKNTGTFTFTRATGIPIYRGDKWSVIKFSNKYASSDFTTPGSTPNANPVNYYNYNAAATAVPSGVSVLSNVSINITVYDKSELYTAKENLQKSIDELSILDQSYTFATADSLSEAQTLVDDASKILAKRATTQDEIDTWKNKLNSYVFSVSRVAGSYSGWTYGATGHTDKTYLEDVVSNSLKYSATFAKYFTVTIDRELAKEWTTGTDADATKTVTNASTYASSGYVQDAGDYTIKFTPKTELSDGILHKVQWSSGSAAETITTTLTINRAQATVNPADVASVNYDGTGHTQTFAINDNTIQLKGGMTADGTTCTVKLSKENLSVDTNTAWESCGNSVQFTEVGTHKIYYRIEIKNHYGVGGGSGDYFEFTIDKANIVVNFSTTNLIQTYYGDAVLDSAALAGYVTSAKANSAMLSSFNAGNVLNTGGPLSALFTLGLNVDGAFPIATNDNLTPAGTYPVTAYQYTAINDRSDTLKAENADVTTWEDRLNVTYTENNYTIQRKAITLSWSYDGATAYDALAHAPTATVASGLVDGGEDFTPVVSVKEGDVPLVSGEAVWAGSYTATVENTTDNYDIPSPDYDFVINARELYLDVTNETAGYAQYIGNTSSGFITADKVFEDYKNKYETNFASIFSFVDCAMAGSDSPLSVITVDIVGITKTGDYYDAGTHAGALILRLLTEQDDANANFNLVNSYVIKANYNGDFDITYADITTDVTEVRLTYNGQDQDFTLVSTEFTLSGYEEENKATDGIVTIGYSLSVNGPFSTDDLISLKDHAQVGTIIFYEVSAKNHNSQVYSFTAYMDQLNIEFTVGAQDIDTNPVYYGDDIPTSNELRDHLSITYVATDNRGEATDYSINGILGLYLAKAGARVEQNATAGKYDLSVESIKADVSLNNFIITFVDALGNANGDKDAFEISKRPLVVDWRQDSWDDGGITFTYSAYNLTIYPTVRRFRSRDLEYFESNKTGEGTGGVPILDHNGDMYVENYVSGDVISLKEWDLGINVGDYYCQTELTKTYNMQNYYLVNPEMTFHIVPRNVTIKIFDQETTYGNVSNVLLGNLSTNKLRWDYYSDGGVSLKFMADKHSAYYMLSVDGLSNTLDAGEYDIKLSVDTASDTTGITSNYNITVYRQDADGNVTLASLDKAAVLTINKATFSLKQSSFDIDGSPKDDGEYSPVEECNIDSAVIREIIRLVGGTKPNDVTVYLTDFYTSYPTSEPSDADWSDTRTISINDEKQLGTFYIYIKLENKNYNDFTAVVTINRYSDWISITLGGGITAIYGDKLLSSDELFAALRENVVEVIGVMDDNGQLTNPKGAWDVIKDRGYFSLNVNNNTDLNTILEVGFYSIFIEVDEDASKIEDGDAVRTLHFRFKTAENGTQPSNVDIYEITKRPVYLIWDESTQTEFLYGVDSEGFIYDIANLVDGDEILVELQYGVDDSNGNPGDLSSSTVGDYVVFVNQESLVHDNYRIAIVGEDKKQDGSLVTEDDLSFKFTIIPRPITITFDKYDEESGEKIDNLTLTYGDLDAKKDRISSYLNSSNVYELSGDLGAFIASEVFEIKLVDDVSAYDYLPAHDYVLTVENKNKNFDVQCEENAVLIIKKADFIITNLEFATAYFNGKDIKPDIVDETLDFGFIVDTDEHGDILIQTEDGSWVSLKYFTLKNAGTYKLNVKVEADNYNPSTREVEFTIEKADVTINLSSFEKEYGKILGSGDFASVISDYIKANGNVQYVVRSNGEVITIDGIADEFIFYVVAGGIAGVNGGESIADGNFANNVGAYRIYHEFADESEKNNYNVTYANNCNAGAYIITPAEVDVEWYVGADNVTSGDEFVYSGSALNMTAQFKTVYFENGEMKYGYKDLDVIGSSGIDVNTYTATAGFLSAESNYTLNSATTALTYVITKRTVNITITSQEKEYGSTKAEIVAGFNGSWTVNSYYDADGWTVDKDDLAEFLADDIALSLDLSAYDDDDYVPYTDVAYNIVGSNSNGNFDVVFSDDKNAGGKYGIFTIVRAEVVYDHNAAYTVVYDGTEQDIDFFDTLASHVTLKGDVEWNRDNVTITYVGYASGELPTIKSGTKVVGFKIEVANHKDYDTSITVVVRKAQVVLSITTTEFEYGSTNLTSQELCEAMNISINEEAGDPINVDLYEVFKFSVDAVDVGEYALKIEVGADLSDFVEATLDVDTDEKQFIVVPKTLGVDWGNTELIYNGKEQIFEAVGFIGEVGTNYVTATAYSVIGENGESAAFGKTVGEYQVKISINAQANPNYVLDENDMLVTFKIVQKELQIEWTEEDFVYDGEAHTLTAQIVGGVIDGDEVNLKFSAGFFTADTHIASVSVDNENYKVSDADAEKEFTIAAKVVELTWEIKNFVYNAQMQCPKAYVSASSLVGNDICEVVVTGGGINAGAHTATAIELNNSNYALPSQVTYVFAIAQLELSSIIWTNTSLEYKEVNGHAVAQAPTATGVGMLPGDNVVVEISGAGSNVGSYRATAVGVNNSNYTVGSSTANISVGFQITQAENSFDKELVLPETEGGLPSLEDFESVTSKYGNATVKYYTDEALTKEYTGNLSDASNGTYYVVVEVKGTDNYKGCSQTFTVAVSGNSSNAGLIVGIIVAVLAVLGAAAAVIIILLKKKKKNDKADEDEE